MRFVACALLLLALPAAASAEELTKEKVDKLRAINQSIEAVVELNDQQILDLNRTVLAKDYFLHQASQIVGREVTAEEMPDLLKEKESVYRQVTGFFTFTNILWVFAGILLAVAVIWLAGLYLLAILIHIPAVVYEVLCYAAVGAAFYSGNMWLMFPACILLPGCLHLTKFLHLSDRPKNFRDLRNFDYDEAKVNGVKFNYAQFSSMVCAATFGVVAYYYGSALIGFLAVMSLFSLLGFSILVTPLCYCIGFKEEDSIPRTVCAAFLLLGLYVANHIATVHGYGDETNLMYMKDVFGPGVLFIGTFVYFIGLLIVSSRYYVKTDDARYWVLQLLTIVSGIAALYIGSIYDLGLLRGIGGTFFFMYCLEKYFEIPWGRVGWAWSLLGLSGGLYWLAGFAQKHPEFFMFGLK